MNNAAIKAPILLMAAMLMTANQAVASDPHSPSD